MKTRLALLVGMPALFLAITLTSYAITGQVLLLSLGLAVLAIGGVAVGILLLVRHEVATCFHLEEGGARVRVGRPWPYREQVFELSELRFRHLGAKLYRLEAGGLSLAFDQSTCDCMSDERFAELAGHLSGRHPIAASS